VVQVKKEAVRDAILASARTLFERQGYAQSTMSQIARQAGVAPATLYVYFPSKLKVFFAIYDPWLRRRLEALARACRRIRQPRARLERLILGLWRDIPFADNVFSNNLMQAVSIADPAEGYDGMVLNWAKQYVIALLTECLSPARCKALDLEHVAHLLFMAFDGFSLGAHLAPKRPCDTAMAKTMADMLLGPGDRSLTPPPGPLSAPRNRKTAAACAADVP
jgi:AcrR family transcriptional regulator